MNPGCYGFPGPHVWQSPAAALADGETTFPLPIQREPDIMLARLVCISAELNWQIGDVIDGAAVVNGAFGAPALNCGYSRCGDGTAGGGLTLGVLATGTIFTIKRYGGGGAYFTITNAKWQVRAMAIWFAP